MYKSIVIALLVLAGGTLLLGTAPVQAQRLQRLHATLTVTSSTTAPGGSCAGLLVTLTGAGLASDLGKFTAAQQHCINPTGPEPLAFTNGVYRWTNATGDEIFGRYNGRLVPTDTSDADSLFIVEGNFTVEGGAGRFAGVVGSGVATGLLSAVTGDSTILLEASIERGPAQALRARNGRFRDGTSFPIAGARRTPSCPRCDTPQQGRAVEPARTLSSELM